VPAVALLALLDLLPGRPSCCAEQKIGAIQQIPTGVTATNRQGDSAAQSVRR
jgi:hypothetical protein